MIGANPVDLENYEAIHRPVLYFVVLARIYPLGPYTDMPVQPPQHRPGRSSVANQATEEHVVAGYPMHLVFFFSAPFYRRSALSKVAYVIDA